LHSAGIEPATSCEYTHHYVIFIGRQKSQ
jgi:hypothetical protein